MALSKRKTQATCSLTGCVLNDERILCFKSMVVYQVKCNNCHQFYIGSTVRALHMWMKEHHSRMDSSVFKHQQSCTSAGTQSVFPFTVSIIASDVNCINLRFREAMLIKALKPSLNNKEECGSFQHLIFLFKIFYISNFISIYF